MGWGSAGDIFDPLADAVVAKVEAGNVEEDQATDILATLIDKLQDGDWDTEDESLERYADKPYVVAAFARCNVRMRVDLSDVGDVAALLRRHVKAGMPPTQTLWATDRAAEEIVEAMERQ